MIWWLDTSHNGEQVYRTNTHLASFFWDLLWQWKKSWACSNTSSGKLYTSPKTVQCVPVIGVDVVAFRSMLWDSRVIMLTVTFFSGSTLSHFLLSASRISFTFSYVRNWIPLKTHARRMEGRKPLINGFIPEKQYTRVKQIKTILFDNKTKSLKIM